MVAEAVRITATFSDGLRQQLSGRAIGDEFTLTAKARIVGADEALLDMTPLSAKDSEYVAGELDVRLLLSHGRVISEGDELP